MSNEATGGEREARCEKCRWWDNQESTGCPEFGQCHRFPPRYSGEDVMQERNWPTTNADDWCGEFAARTPAGDAAKETLLDMPAGDWAESCGGTSRLKRAIRRLPQDFGRRRTVRELCELTAGDALEWREFGMTSLTELRRLLAADGLHLRGDQEPGATT